MAYKRILVPVDGSPTSGLCLREAIAFAKAQKARLALVHVVDVHNSLLAGARGGAYMADLVEALEQRGRRILAKAAELARKAGLACDTVLLETLTGPAAEAIVRQAKKSRADLIVMGTHGRRGLRRLVMGSDTEQVARNARGRAYPSKHGVLGSPASPPWRTPRTTFASTRLRPAGPRRRWW